MKKGSAALLYVLNLIMIECVDVENVVIDRKKMKREKIIRVSL